MENAWISIGAPVAVTHVYFFVQHSFINEDFVYLKEHSNIIRFSVMIVHIANDLGTYKRENETGYTPKLIQCFMNETGASEEEACEYMKSMMHTPWKKMDEEVCNSSLPESFKYIAINIAKMAMCLYQHGDGHTIQDPIIKSLIEQKRHSVTVQRMP
ncbi:hypothetical protein Lal_00027850 [Lupinus albus]|nr:hypothetical protein Lal_00027850 [Lupinus albus]